MSETKHTPGPWTVAWATDKRGADEIRTAGPVVPGATRGIEIAKITNRVKGPVGDWRANARLMAASPALLDACRLATPLLVAFEEAVKREAMSGHPDISAAAARKAMDNIDAVIVAIRDAVAAATGGNP